MIISLKNPCYTHLNKITLLYSKKGLILRQKSFGSDKDKKCPARFIWPLSCVLGGGSHVQRGIEDNFASGVERRKTHSRCTLPYTIFLPSCFVFCLQNRLREYSSGDGKPSVLD